MQHLALLSSFVGLISLLGSSCMVPYQLPKVTLAECFTQSFSFVEDPADTLNNRLNKQHYPSILEKILRIQDAEQVSDLQIYYAGDSLVDDLMNEKIISKGTSVLTVSLVPDKKPKEFYISGNGQYDIINTKTSEVFYSARYWYIDSIHYSLVDLLNDPDFSIPLYFDQVLINHMDYANKPGTWEHTPTSHIRIDVQINRNIINETRKPIFSIDYSAEHKVSIRDTEILEMGEEREEYRTIGYIKFCPSSFPYDKIIDLRGLNLSIRRDYRKFKGIYEGKE